MASKLEDTSDAAFILSQQYEIVRRIISTLPESDLQNCEKVNSVWKDAVKAERQMTYRLRPETICWTGPTERRENYYDKFEKQKSPVHSSLYQHIEAWKTNTKMSPKVSINICIGDPLGDRNSSQSFLVDPFRVTDIIGSRNISICSRGIVVAPSHQEPNEIENTSTAKETPAFTSYVFPDIPNVDIIPFYFFEKDAHTYSKKIQEEGNFSKADLAFDVKVVQDMLGPKVKGKEDKIKSVILMTNVLSYERSALLIQALGRVTKKKLAVGGCVGNLAFDSADSSNENLDSMLDSFDEFEEEQNPHSDYAKTVGMCFVGDNVKAASVLLTSNMKTRGKVEAELLKLKSCEFDDRNSVAFMFACCGRGAAFYKRKSNVESEVFRKLFPKTDLIGIFGNGEIGMTYLPQADQSDMKKNVDSFSDPSASKRLKIAEETRYKPSEFAHSFTTVFLMLSFKT